MFSSLIKRCRKLVVERAAAAHATDWKKRRAPLSSADRALQSLTHDWLRVVPRALHPTQLCRHYPRVANRIAACWADEPQVARLLAELLIDRRGGRAGFAPRIRAEIECLYRHNAGRMNPLLRRAPVAAPPERRGNMGLKLAVRPLRK